MLKRLKAELRIMKATTVAQVSAVPPPGKALAQLDGAITAVKKTERTVKAVKWICAVFHLETAAVQSVPTQIGRGDFTAFALILRMDMGGRGDKNPKPNLNRSPSPSQSVAVIYGKGVAKAGALFYREPLSRPAASLSPPSGERAGRGDRPA